MRNQCGIKNCNNNRSKGFHLFRFPLHRKDHLKRWLEAIGEVDFQPTKSDVICSAHFTTNDYMIRPFAHDVRLKRLAVPSIFQDPLEITPMIANIINSNASASEVIMSLPTLVVHSQTKKSKNSEKAETYCFQPLEKTANTSTVDSTIKITLINKQKITNKSKYYFKNQKMNLKKKQMQTFITTLKQDLIKNKKTIQLQQNLLTGMVLYIINIIIYYKFIPRNTN
ncbi:THAP3 protein, partial [Acromyrmex charruanus]